VRWRQVTSSADDRLWALWRQLYCYVAKPDVRQRNAAEEKLAVYTVVLLYRRAGVDLDEAQLHVLDWR
jgi:hypothetical protein